MAKIWSNEIRSNEGPGIGAKWLYGNFLVGFERTTPARSSKLNLYHSERHHNQTLDCAHCPTTAPAPSHVSTGLQLPTATPELANWWAPLWSHRGADALQGWVLILCKVVFLNSLETQKHSCISSLADNCSVARSAWEQPASRQQKHKKSQQWLPWAIWPWNTTILSGFPQQPCAGRRLRWIEAAFASHEKVSFSFFLTVSFFEMGSHYGAPWTPRLKWCLCFSLLSAATTGTCHCTWLLRKFHNRQHQSMDCLPPIDAASRLVCLRGKRKSTQSHLLAPEARLMISLLFLTQGSYVLNAENVYSIKYMKTTR